MSQDQDIIRHIIRDIVASSSAVIKQRQSQHVIDSVTGAVAGLSTSSPEPQPGSGVNPNMLPTDPGAAHPMPPPPLPPMQQLQHLFVSGIKSHIPTYVVSDTLAAFMIRAVVLDPRNDFRIDRELTKEEVERLINLCVEKITCSNNIVMETVKMQVYFDSIFPAQADYLHKEKMTRISSCMSVLKEITDVTTKNISIYEGLYRKIVTYVLIRSHIGNPTDIRVVREATAALESVFPQSELSAFISLPRGEKEAQLNGLTQLVTGIRLFNKHLGKGGETVEDLVELCLTEMKVLLEELEAHTSHTETTLQTLHAVIDCAVKAVDLDLSASALTRVKTAVVFYRQYLMYLDALREQVEETREALAALGKRFDDTIGDLKFTCKSKTAVPVDQVYPQFIALSSLWTNYMDNLFLLAFRRGILDNIDFHSKSFELSLSEKILQASEPFKKDIEPEIHAENVVVEKAAELMAAISIINKTIEVVHPGNTTRYFQLPVEYGGFCPFTLIRKDGSIVPGNKNLGMLRYRDRLFAFATEEGAREFAKYPDRYMEGVLELAKRSADLVQLLHLYSYFPTVDALENAKSFTRQRLMGQMPMVSDASTQVDTHIVDTHIDKKYQWNEWELRRQALMLVNLKTKLTHSAQTDISHFRRESETQHYAPKTNATQTMRESATNVPRKVNFLSGLRSDGNPKNKFKVVDLTLSW